MAIVYVNAEKLNALDFTGEEMEQMKEEIADLYNLSHYKELITEYAAELGNGHTTEDTAAEIAKRFFVEGYMQAVSELTDRYSLLLVDGFKGR